MTKNISTATVNEAITGGEAIIKGNFDQDSASHAGEPDQLRLSAVCPVRGKATPPSARPGCQEPGRMVQAGIIAFILVAILMILALPSARHHRRYLP